jgi:hypothetical protein
VNVVSAVKQQLQQTTTTTTTTTMAKTKKAPPKKTPPKTKRPVQQQPGQKKKHKIGEKMTAAEEEKFKAAEAAIAESEAGEDEEEDEDGNNKDGEDDDEEEEEDGNNKDGEDDDEEEEEGEDKEGEDDDEEEDLDDEEGMEPASKKKKTGVKNSIFDDDTSDESEDESPQEQGGKKPTIPSAGKTSKTLKAVGAKVPGVIGITLNAAGKQPASTDITISTTSTLDDMIETKVDEDIISSLEVQMMVFVTRTFHNYKGLYGDEATMYGDFMTKYMQFQAHVTVRYHVTVAPFFVVASLTIIHQQVDWNNVSVQNRLIGHAKFCIHKKRSAIVDKLKRNTLGKETGKARRLLTHDLRQNFIYKLEMICGSVT